MAVLAVKEGVSPALAILAGLLTGTAIGLFNGFMVTTFGIPSFVVTLAGLLGWQGALLLVLGDTGTINLPADTVITDLAGTFYDPSSAGSSAVGVVAAYLDGSQRAPRGTRSGAGERPHGRARDPAVLIGAAACSPPSPSSTRTAGSPSAPLILVAFCAIFVYITKRTTFGRHIYAVGGNAEAARRAASASTASRSPSSRSPPRWRPRAASSPPHDCWR